MNKPDELELEGVPMDVKNGNEEKSFRELLEQFEENQEIRAYK